MTPASSTFPLVPRSKVEGLPFGAMPSRRRGAGWDLAGSRPYRPGDDIRWLDRRGSARLSSARSSDEFMIREHQTDEATRVVIVVDRRPTMALFPQSLPWLHKPAAIAEAGRLIIESALEARCFVGYLDEANAEHPNRQRKEETPFWRPADGQTEAWQITERYLSHRGFHAPEDALSRALGFLSSVRRGLPPGTFVFVLSDFLAAQSDEVWTSALERGWDLIPVVIQDPAWEQSFPDVAGTALPLADPVNGDTSLVRLTRAEVQGRRRQNEDRLAALLTSFDRLHLDWVLISTEGDHPILEAFLAWSGERQRGARMPA